MPFISGGGGGGGVTPPVTLTGTDPATVPLTILSAAGQTADLLNVYNTDGQYLILTVDRRGQPIFTGPASGGSHTFRVQSSDGTKAIDVVDDGSGTVDTTKLGGLTVDLAGHEVRVGTSEVGHTVGFYGTGGVARQTGVAVSAAAIHAALVSLNLITA